MPARKARPKSKRRDIKDRVVQARIPEDLDAELRDRAGRLGISVSTIVRNVLMNTFDLVEGVVHDSAEIARAFQGRRAAVDESPRARANSAASPGADAPIGWQELVLNVNGVCEHCNTILSKGKRAAVGIPVGDRPRLSCLDCLASLGAADPEMAGDSSDEG